MSNLPKKITDLSPEEQRVLLAQLLHRKANKPKFFPLSFAQQRLWFLDQLVPGNAFYNVPAALRLGGTLNIAALEQTFNEIQRRHETLRTTFVLASGQPVQAIAPSSSLPLPIVDLLGLPVAEREAQVQRLATVEAQRPFNISQGPLLRVTLLQLGETEHVLLLTMHHIVSDGWSMEVLIGELAALYTAFASGQPSPLKELPIQYADFAQWQRQWLQGEVLCDQLSYWKQQLDNIPVLLMPTDRPRPAVQTYRGATQLVELPKSLASALSTLSQREEATLFMTLLAAFTTLLYRYTGQSDIPIGVPIANRNRSEIEQLIGFFVNSLVLRTNLSGNPTFRELLARVRQVALGAYAHQDLPFEKLVEELHPERDLSRNPLFQVAFALQNAPTEKLELPSLTLSPLKFDTKTNRFDLELHLWEPSQGSLWWENAEGFRGFIAYSTDLFDQATIARMLEHFQTLLEGIVTNPNQCLSDLPLLSATERQQLLVDWNDAQADYPKDLCIHQLFEAQVERSPDAIALVFEDVETRAFASLTYRQLNTRSNQLAHYLQKLGVGPEVLVGICVERSLEMIVGLLGILKAGGAYVPFDPTYPQERLTFMLKDAAVPVVVTQQHLVERLKEQSSRVVCLDKDWEVISAPSAPSAPSAFFSKENPTSGVKSDNLAYVIYTSGSTGKPKGVSVQHQGLCNLAYAQEVFNACSKSRILQFASLSFDASIFEIVMALRIGATLCLTTAESRLPGPALIELLQNKAITHALLPPALLAVLPEEELPVLQTVISGGEACSSEIVEQWARSRQFFNAYGPTEASVCVTVTRLLNASSKPPLGRPIANTQIYLLDRHLNPVPISVPGELYIGGDGLARGYLNRPELTAQKFIPNPFSSEPGARLYKTGDLARYRPDGNIEFLGRLDHQVKLRGFRIELGEIEAVLSQHPAVQETVVISYEDANAKKLVAYIAPDSQYSAAQEQMQAVQLQAEQVSQWQMLYEEIYRSSAPPDPKFNITGWNSSYTGQPIPAEQMREWVNNRVERILALRPRRVLEIGCGTGLLLFRIAPHCTQYWGTDFSQASLDYIQQQLEPELPQVSLRHSLADDFEDIAEAFDTVILNSVIQYFPNVDYLLRVLEGAVKATRNGGFIYIGDIRSLPLLEAFHASVQLAQAEPSLDQVQLQQRVQIQLLQETELAIDPAFFSALRSRFPQISHVQIQLTRGRHSNELTDFRYDAILHIGTKTFSPPENSTRLDWFQDKLTVATVRQRLIETEPELLEINRVSNARVTMAVKTAEWLASFSAPKTVGQWRETLGELQETGVDPENWWNLGEELPYTIDISWSDSGATGRYDVVFRRRQSESERYVGALMPSGDRGVQLRPWHSYTNNPLQAKLTRQLVPQLRLYLEQKLPEYMVPSAFVVLAAMPMTLSGKVDRRALPGPDPLRRELAGAYEMPRTAVEDVLRQIWTEVLGLERVGIHDNFFELGGHSLLATQLISRVRDAFQVELPLRRLFEAPTIAKLSQAIKSTDDTRQVPALMPISRETHRRTLLRDDKES